MWCLEIRRWSLLRGRSLERNMYVKAEKIGEKVVGD
jgi:hypothetical protein